MNIARILRDRLSERASFVGTMDWLLSLYDRVLNRIKNLPLPGRRRICLVSVRRFDAPVALRLGTTDWLLLNEIVARDEYRDVLAADLGPIRQIIDLGANIGLSVRLWRTYYPDAYIMAVEPDEGNAAVLKENVRLAGHEERVTILRACAMGYVRPVQLTGRGGGEWSFSAHDVAESDLKVVTMPDLLIRGSSGRTVDLLKCDIEGAEAELFENCGEWMPHVRHVMMEVHAPYTVADLQAALQRNTVDYQIRDRHDYGDRSLVFFSNTKVRAFSLPIL